MDVTQIPSNVPVLTWEQVVVIGIFFLFQWLNNRDTQKKIDGVKTTLTKNNGGGSVKDALDRIESKQVEQSEALEWLDARLDKVEASADAAAEAVADAT